MSSFFTLTKDENNYIPITTAPNDNIEKIIFNYNQFTPIFNEPKTKNENEMNDTEETLKKIYIVSIYIVGLYIFYRIL